MRSSVFNLYDGSITYLLIIMVDNETVFPHTDPEDMISCRFLKFLLLFLLLQKKKS